MKTALFVTICLLAALPAFSQTDQSNAGKPVFTKNAPAPIGPYSQAVKAGGLIFVSGQIALDPATGLADTSGIREETQRVLKNIEAVLKEAGSGLEKVVKTSVFMTNLGQFSQMNEVYGQFFTKNPPARETVQVAKLPRGMHLEISVIAIE